MKKPLTIEEVKEIISGVADEIRIPLLSELHAKFDQLVLTGCDPVAACYVCLDWLKSKIESQLSAL